MLDMECWKMLRDLTNMFIYVLVELSSCGQKASRRLLSTHWQCCRMYSVKAEIQDLQSNETKWGTEEVGPFLLGSHLDVPLPHVASVSHILCWCRTKSAFLEKWTVALHCTAPAEMVPPFHPCSSSNAIGAACALTWWSFSRKRWKRRARTM